MEIRLYQESGCDRCTCAEKRNKPPHVTSRQFVSLKQEINQDHFHRREKKTEAFSIGRHHCNFLLSLVLLRKSVQNHVLRFFGRAQSKVRGLGALGSRRELAIVFVFVRFSFLRNKTNAALTNIKNKPIV